MRVINPANGETVRELTDDDADSIGAKVAQARRAQPQWGARPLSERLEIIRRFRQLLIERADHLAAVLTSEMGKPLWQAHNELTAVLERIDFFLGATENVMQDEVVLKTGSMEERIRHEPLGMVANISAWNYPYFVGSNVVVPALLTGNTLLYKPSELATLTGLEIERALHDAGAPAEVFSVVAGDGAAGAQLLEHPVDGVFFTGSYPTGLRIAQTVAPRLIRMQLELGGKDPCYVAPDVQVDTTASAVADGAFYNTGQSCCAIERVYVHQDIWEPFVEQFVETVRGFVVGDPTGPETYIGPLARREAQVRHLQQQVEDARDKGARVLLGGQPVDRPGAFFAPTVLDNVSHDMLVMQQESFGPLIGLMRVRGDEEAVRAMRDTEYGLAASIYSTDRARAERVLAQLPVGSAYYNCSDRVSPRLPWSGRRHSGVGCTLSTYGIRAFLHHKGWHLRQP